METWPRFIPPPIIWVAAAMMGTGALILSNWAALQEPPLIAVLPAFVVVPQPSSVVEPCAPVVAVETGPLPMPHFVLGLSTLRIYAAGSRIVAEDRIHSLKALLRAPAWNRHLRVRPASGHRGVRFVVDVTQVTAAAGTAFCHWLENEHQWKSGPYPCEVAY